MTGSRLANVAEHRGQARFGGVAGVLAMIFWGAAAVLEIAGSNIGHSLISRPERLFSNEAWHWPVVLLVGATLAAEVVAARALIKAAGRSRLAGLAGLAFGLALLFRMATAAMLPSQPGGYSVERVAALTSNLVVILTPPAILLMAIVVRRRSPWLALFSAGVAISMVWAALWAMTWAARSGASQPQLLALEPVCGLAAGWSAAVGAWLLGRPERLWSGARTVELPSPGRKSAVALAVLLVVGVVGASSSFVNTYRSEIFAQLTGRTKVETMFSDLVDRTYRVYRPENELAHPGLVIVLHGSFGGGLQIENTTGFDAQADRLGWIAVYPDGVADGWDAFGSGPTWGSHPGADDISFMSQLIMHFESTDNVDPNRVYITGHSRGGMMAYRLGCAFSGVVAAIAPVSGNMATASGSADVPCPLTSPVSVLAIHGTADGTIPMAGGKVDIIYSPMADVIAKWRSLDGCGATSQVSVNGWETTTVWSCAGGSTVSTEIQAGGCHCWTADDSRVIADFFVAHPRVAAGGPDAARRASRLDWP
jgi:polyhydroxybutyrate depolymerase